MRSFRRDPPSTATCLLVLAFLVLPRPGTAGTVRLSLGDAVRRAVEGNPAFLAASWQPRIAETSVDAALGAFDPRLSSSASAEASRTPSPAGAVDLSRSGARAGASALLRTGGSLSVEAASTWSRADGGGSSASPSLTAALRQPLLKGAGRTVAEGPVTAASLDLEEARAGLRGEALAVAARAIALYLGHARSMEAVETRRSALEAARRLDAENRARVRAGLLAEVDLLESELAIARREADLVEAERARDASHDLLRAFLALPSGTDVDIADPRFDPQPEIPPESQSLAYAAALRPDIDGARRSLEARSFRERLSRDALLPSLDTVGSASLSGLDRATGEAFSDVGEGRYPSWSLSLEFGYPLGNRSARADARAAEHLVRQARETVNASLLAAETETRAAYRSVEAKRKSEEAQGKAVAAASARVASFRKKASVGLATAKEVLDAETDLVAAELSLTEARIDHRLARYEVLRTTGLLAERFSLYPVTRPAPPEAR